MKTKISMLVIFCCLLLAGCEGATGSTGLHSPDPTERGCSYIAAAIVTAALIRGMLNK